MSRVLCVGLTCLDIVNICSNYPPEDTDLRCESQVWSKGGNAANTSTVLAQLLQAGGEERDESRLKAECLSVLANNYLLQFFLDDFKRFGVITDNFIIAESAKGQPTSCVMLSKATGSRTIVHCNNNMTELSAAQHFSPLDLGHYAWIHFEGRNVDKVVKMISAVRSYNTARGAGKEGVRVSVEVEKCRPELEQLIPLGDVVFLSKDFARWKGHQDAEGALRSLIGACRPGALLVCAWGEQGAAAMQTGRDEIFRTKSYPPPELVDTLGAGDTFIAGVVYALLRKAPVDKALDFGCKLAGAKCGEPGLDLRHIINRFTI